MSRYDAGKAMKGSSMTAIGNFVNAPLPQSAAAPTGWGTQALFRKVWSALQGYGQLRAAHQLSMLADHRALADPVLARQLRAAAAQCRQAARVHEGEKS